MLDFQVRPEQRRLPTQPCFVFASCRDDVHAMVCPLVLTGQSSAEARARAQGRRLDIIFTSMIPWVADKPWEFAYDLLRKSFLVAEDVQFVRNVLNAVPAQHLREHAGPLRILVV